MRACVHAYLGLRGVDAQLLVECVVPDVLHVVPVADNAVLHRVVHLQHRAQLASLVPYHQVLGGKEGGRGGEGRGGKSTGRKSIT